jgi:uncharacterized protein
MLKTSNLELFNEKFGVITVKDIMAELKNIRPGPTTDFVARFNDGVDDIKDLREAYMELEGTNVAAFGAFYRLRRVPGWTGMSAS